MARVKRDTANEPMKIEIGGHKFVETNYENGFTLAQSQIIAPIIAGMANKDGAEIALGLDIAGILAAVLLYEGETVWKKDNYLKKKAIIENSEVPEEVGVLVQNFFVSAPLLMQKFFQIYTKIAEKM